MIDDTRQDSFNNRIIFNAFRCVSKYVEKMNEKPANYEHISTTLSRHFSMTKLLIDCEMHDAHMLAYRKNFTRI